MSEQNSQSSNFAEPAPTEKQVSKPTYRIFDFIIIGFILGLIGSSVDPAWVGLIPSLILFVTAFILGICAWKQSGRSKGILYVFPGLLCMGITMYAVYMAISFQSMPRQISYRLVCAVNLNGLGKAMAAYANDYQGRLLTTSHWCDLLVERADVGFGFFVCKRSDAIKGESSYAMNKYVTDLNFHQLPKDVVVLFETDYGRIAERSWWKLRWMRKNDDRYVSVKEVNCISTVIRSDKLRWNQVGRFDILTTAHHDSKGCNILFGDGHVEFVKTTDIPKLRWKP